MRRGSLWLEAGIGIVALGAIAACATWGAGDRLAAKRLEQRAADQDAALAVLDRLRHGRPPELPDGWSLEIADAATAGPGFAVATVIGPDHVRLSTLVRR